MALVGGGALVDVVGGLCARRGLDEDLAVSTPAGGWAVRPAGHAWRTEHLAAGADRDPLPGLSGPLHPLLDVSAGRRPIGPMIAERKVHVHHLAALLRLAPVVEEVPGVSGGAALARSAKTLAGLGRLASALPGLR